MKSKLLFLPLTVLLCTTTEMYTSQQADPSISYSISMATLWAWLHDGTPLPVPGFDHTKRRLISREDITHCQFLANNEEPYKSFLHNKNFQEREWSIRVQYIADGFPYVFITQIQ